MNNDFTAEEFTFYQEILKKFPGEQRIKSETDTDVLCPAHDDHRPSLGIDLRRNGVGPKIVFNCRSQECEPEHIIEAVGLSYSDLQFSPNGSTNGHKRPEFEGCTLEAYAALKNLPVEFLEGDEVGLEQTTYAKVPALYIPYANEVGDVIATRFRVSLHKDKSGPDNRFRWKRGDTPTLYGLHRIAEAREAGYVLLVEGESDCHVSWYHNLPALGIPGAKNWKNKWSEYLDGIGTILVAVEPDKAGEGLWSKLVASASLCSRLEKVGFSDAV